MPLDGTSTLDAPKRSPLPSAGLSFGIGNWAVEPVRPRPLPAGFSSRCPGNLSSLLAILSRARALLANEHHWCRGSLVEGRRNIRAQGGAPVAVRRYCALGAIMQAGCELGLGSEGAAAALRSQICRPIEDWNDHPLRTHADVIAAFDATIAEVSSHAR